LRLQKCHQRLEKRLIEENRFYHPVPCTTVSTWYSYYQKNGGYFTTSTRGAKQKLTEIEEKEIVSKVDAVRLKGERVTARTTAAIAQVLL